jgi:hypothetical protein
MEKVKYVSVYCGMAPKGRSIEHPLLANDYAHIAASWVTDRFIPYATRMNATEKSLHNNDRTPINLKPFSTINALNPPRSYNMQPLNVVFSIQSDCARHKRRSSIQLSKEAETQSSQ